MDEALQIQRVTVGPLALRTQCYILWLEGREDCLVIDPGDEPEHIRQAMGGKRLAAILLTHGHFDHIGAVGALAGEGVEIIIHRLDAPLLSDPERNVSAMVRRRITAPMATCLVEDGQQVQAAGITLTVLHTPGHTPGSVCYQTGTALFTGDTLFTQGWGRTDLPGGDEAAMQRSLRRLAPLAQQYAIYPGHGG